MESQETTRMEQSPDPGMCGCDRDIFLRVWGRVSPEDRPDSPIVITEEPEQAVELAPAEEQPAASTVPALTAEAVVPVQAAGSAEVPAARDRAGDDFPTPDDVPCLGRGAAPDLEQLQEFTAQELAHWRAYQALARRVSGPAGRVLAALAADCRKRAKRLSAALFLISGVRHWPAEQGTVAMPRSYFGALREHFLSEQNRGCAYRAAAEDCRDACLSTLYLDLADECAEHAGRIRTLLENT